MTTPKFPAPPPVCAHQSSRFGSEASRRNDAARTAVLVDGDDFDRVQIIGGESELAAEKSKGATAYVAAHADRRIFAEWNDDAPVVMEGAEGLADGRAATLEEIFEEYNPSRKHGSIYLLTPEEKAAVLRYVREL